jgi:hypothetical protein
MTFRIALPPSRYRTAQDVARFHYAMLDRIRALPGVTAAGATARLPLAGVMIEADPVRLEGRPNMPNALPPLAEMRAATPGYFEAMGIPLASGRVFDRNDTESVTGAVLVTKELARKLMESREPVGSRACVARSRGRMWLESSAMYVASRSTSRRWVPSTIRW